MFDYPIDGSMQQLSIKRFAEISGISESALRYYDKRGIFVPSERGENNYRYYAPFQVLTVNYVNVLIDLGMPLEDIKRLANDRKPQDILDSLIECENQLDDQLKKAQAAYSIIHTLRRRINRGLKAEVNSIGIRQLESYPIVLGDEIDWTGAEDFYGPFIEFCKSAEKNRINLSFPVGGYYESMTVFAQAPSKPSRFFSADPSGPTKRGPGEFLVGYTLGYYGDMKDIAQRMIAYALELKVRFVGPLYVDYLLDEISIVDHEQYLAQVAVQVIPERS